MLLFIVALPFEAKPILDFFHFKQDLSQHQFPVYRNAQNAYLIISGTGKVSAAIATTHLIQYCQQIPAPHHTAPMSEWLIVNIGLAGAIKPIASMQKNTLYLINKITDFDSGHTFFPTLFIPQSITQTAITCLSQVYSTSVTPIIDCHSLSPTYDFRSAITSSLVDMESSGIITASQKYLQTHQCLCFKILSDFGQTQHIDKNFISTLIQSHLPEINQALQQVCHLLQLQTSAFSNTSHISNPTNTRHSTPNTSILADLSTHLHLSFSQQQELQKKISLLDASHSPLPNLVQSFLELPPPQSKLQRQKYFADLLYRLSLFPSPKLLGTSLDTATSKANPALPKHKISAIYVEEKAFSYPVTQNILDRFPETTITPIQHYKEIFNRQNQSLPLGKKFPQLILAVKEAPFLYESPGVCQDFGSSHSYYSSFILGCPFDCDYCFLQGLYPSANFVVFVNLEDFKTALSQTATTLGSLNLALSYDSDLLAVDYIYPLLEDLAPWLENNPHIKVEIRTKSATLSPTRKLPVLPNLLLAYSLSPQVVIDLYESNTPSLEKRLRTILNSLEKGFNIRLCFDPVFIHPELETIYIDFFIQVMTSIPTQYIQNNQVQAISYGFFRLPPKCAKKIKKNRPQTSLLQMPLIQETLPSGEKISTYTAEQQKRAQEQHLEILEKYFPKEQIFFIQE